MVTLPTKSQKPHQKEYLSFYHSLLKKPQNPKTNKNPQKPNKTKTKPTTTTVKKDNKKTHNSNSKTHSPKNLHKKIVLSYEDSQDESDNF